MSRVTAGQPIIVRPQNNVYTALAGIATLALIGAVIAVFVKSQAMDFKIFAM